MNRPKSMQNLMFSLRSLAAATTAAFALMVGMWTVVGVAPSSAMAQDTGEPAAASWPAVPDVPVATARVAVLPVVLMQPPGKQSVTLATGIEELLHFYLDAHFALDVVPPQHVRETLIAHDLSGGPGSALARRVALDLRADYVIGTTLTFGTSARASSFWYSTRDNAWVVSKTVTFSPVMGWRALNVYAREVAFALAERFPRDSEAEKQLADRGFCRYMRSFLTYSLAVNALWRDDFAAARERIAEADAQENTNFPRANALLARLEWRRLQTESGQVTTDQLKEARNKLAAAAFNSPHDFRLVFLQATLSYQLARRDAEQRAKWLADADAELQKVLTLRPTWFAAWEMFLLEVRPALAGLSEPETAEAAQARVELAAAVARAFPASIDAQLIYARVLHHVGANDEAAARLRTLRPRSAHAAMLLGRLLDERGSSDAALSVYQTLVAQQPDHVEARGRVVALAIRQLFRSLASDPSVGITADDVAQIELLSTNFATIDRTGDGVLDEQEFAQLLPALGRGPFAYLVDTAVADERLAYLHHAADFIWKQAMIVAALGGQGEAFGATDAFINSPIAITRFAEMRRSYDNFLDVRLREWQNQMQPLLEPLLVSFYLAQIENEPAMAEHRARQILAREFRGAAVALYLNPERTPRTRFAPVISELPDDMLFDDEG